MDPIVYLLLELQVGELILIGQVMNKPSYIQMEEEQTGSVYHCFFLFRTLEGEVDLIFALAN